MWAIDKAVAQARDDDGSVWVLSAATGRILRLTVTAETIWRACDGLGSTDEVVTRLVESEGWEPEVIQAHVESMIETLRRNHLLLEVTP